MKRGTYNHKCFRKNQHNNYIFFFFLRELTCLTKKEILMHISFLLLNWTYNFLLFKIMFRSPNKKIYLTMLYFLWNLPSYTNIIVFEVHRSLKTNLSKKKSHKANFDNHTLMLNDHSNMSKHISKEGTLTKNCKCNI